MSGEVEVVAPAAPRDRATALEVWAFDLRQAYDVATRLVTTSFVPKTYSGRPEEAAAAIMTGQELGLSPLAALRSIDIIGGVPAMRAVALRALVQSHGHEIWTEETTRQQAVVAGRRHGSDTVERSIWTMDRARELNLSGKDNWRKQPIAMLLARATSELVRLIAADVILGIPYSVEEVQDHQEVLPDVPTRKRKGTTAKRKPLPATAGQEGEDAPAGDVPDGADEPDDPEGGEGGEGGNPAEGDVAVETVKGEEPFTGDPLKPTAEELAEWALLPDEDGDDA